jgi:hypothetical protein
MNQWLKPSFVLFIAIIILNFNGKSYSAVQEIVWKTSASNTIQPLVGVTWTGCRYVVVGAKGTILTSPDGTVWTRNPVDTMLYLMSTVSSERMTVIVGSDGAIFSSIDGLEWTRRKWTTNTGLTGVTWGNNRFVAVGNDGTALMSTDGISWDRQTTGTLVSFADVVWAGSEFIAIGSNGTIMSSPDGVSWKLESEQTSRPDVLYLTDISWSGSSAVIVGSLAGYGIIQSKYETSWGYSSSTNDTTFKCIVWTGSSFLALGKWGFTRISADGYKWVRAKSSLPVTLFDAVCANDAILAVGDGGIIVSTSLPVASTIPADFRRRSNTTTQSGYQPYRRNSYTLNGKSLRWKTGTMPGVPGCAAACNAYITGNRKTSTSESKLIIFYDK